MKKSLLFALALTAASPALAGDYFAAPVAGPTDELTYDRGTPVLTRETDTAFITVMAMEEYFGRPSLVVMVLNKGESSFNFGTENVTAAVAGEKKPTQVYTRQELEAQAENRAAWAAVGAALAASASATSSYSSRTYTPYGSVYSSGTIRNSYAANAENARLQAGIAAGLADRIADARQSALQTTTVRPGESYGGRIVISKPKARLPAPLTLSVEVGGKVETFTFDMRK